MSDQPQELLIEANRYGLVSSTNNKGTRYKYHKSHLYPGQIVRICNKNYEDKFAAFIRVADLSIVLCVYDFENERASMGGYSIENLQVVYEELEVTNKVSKGRHLMPYLFQGKTFDIIERKNLLRRHFDSPVDLPPSYWKAFNKDVKLIKENINYFKFANVII